MKPVIPAKSAGALLITVSALASLGPLFLATGRNFEYEYTILLNLFLLCAFPLLALVPNRNQSIALIEHVERRLVPHALWMTALFPMLLAGPAWYSMETGICPCSLHGFRFWYLLNCYPTILLTQGLLVIFLRARSIGRSRLRVGTIYIFLILGMIFESLLRIFFFPQKHLNHLLWGFLHGPVYDAWIPVDSAIIQARIACGVLALGILLFSLKPQKRKWSWGLVVIWLALGGFAAQNPSVATGTTALNRALAQTIKGNNFVIHFAESDRKSLDLFAKEVAFHMSELTPLLAPVAHPVHIYVYHDRDQKKLWFGGEQTDITDVWTPSIHTTVEGLPHPSIRHELVHALASSYAFHGLGFHPNIAFTEGLAIALAPDGGELSLHASSAYLLKSQKLASIDALFSPLFWIESGEQSYAMAGSFVRFLMDRYGMDKVKTLYGGKTLGSVFPGNAESLIQEWHNLINREYKDEYVMAGEALYNNPGVFFTLCPHTRADLSRRDGPLLALRRPSGWKTGDYGPWKRALEPAKRENQIANLRRDLTHALKTTPRVDLAPWLAKAEALRTPIKHLDDIDLAIMLADLEFLQGRIESYTTFADLARFAETHRIAPFDRQILARLGTQNLTLDAQRSWRLYLMGVASMPTVTPSDPHLLHYLALRRDSTKLKEAELSRLVALGRPRLPSTSFVREWYRLLAEATMDHRWFGLAETVWKDASQAASAGDRDLFLQNSRLAHYLVH